MLVSLQESIVFLVAVIWTLLISVATDSTTSEGARFIGPSVLTKAGDCFALKTVMPFNVMVTANLWENVGNCSCKQARDLALKHRGIKTHSDLATVWIGSAFSGLFVAGN